MAVEIKMSDGILVADDTVDSIEKAHHFLQTTASPLTCAWLMCTAPVSTQALMFVVYL